MKQKEQSQGWRFGPYLLTGSQGQLLRRNRPLPLSPKAVAVLWTLASRAGQVVSKEELLAAVWPGTVVSEGVITNCIGELRRTLGDTTAHPRYIETVSRRGYRFLPTLTTHSVARGQSSGVSGKTLESRSQESESRIPSAPSHHFTLNTHHSVLVGREAELAHLHHLLERALTGERQLVFVTGEAGIGKTALVEAFRQRLETGSRRRPPSPHASRSEPLAPVSLAHGQCIEHYGTGEAYLPVLEALGRLCRRPEGARILDILRQAAPTWLVQLPALLDETEYAALQQKAAGATRERMLREMADALETLTALTPLVLVLEDLHWSDASTVDLLAMVAHGQGREIPLAPLAVKDIRAYLARRFSEDAEVQALTPLIYRRTEGHPLFMVQLTDYLAQQEAPTTDTSALTAAARALPQGLRELIEAQIGRLTVEERQILEAASVVGAEFAVASVVAGAQTPVKVTERTCERLAQRGQFIEERGVEEWPDGAVSGRYGFRHVLYQEVLYKQLGANRRARLHQLVGLREEAGYRERAREHAAELAVHFERGRDTRRAVHYLHQAGINAKRRGALREAIALFTKGLTLLASLPESPEHSRQELQLHLALSAPLMMMKGYTAPEVEQLYARAFALCRQVEHPPLRFSALTGLISFHIARAEFHRAKELGAQCLQLARQMPGVLPHLQAVTLLGMTAYFLGELVLARQYLEEGLALCSSQSSFASVAASQPSLLVTCLSCTAVTLCALGYPAQTLTRSQEALAVAHEHAHPALLALAHHGAFWVRRDRRDIHAAHEHVEALMLLCREQEFPFWLSWGQTYQGWVLIEQGLVEEGMQLMHQGLVAVRAAGAEGRVSDTLAILAQALGRAGRWEEGIAILDKALQHVSIHGERYYEAEIYRLKGELLLQASACVREGQRANPVSNSHTLSRSKTRVRRNYRAKGRQSLDHRYANEDEKSVSIRSSVHAPSPSSR